MSDSMHETVSYAAFLEYRARRMAAPTVGDVPPPDFSGTPPEDEEPGPIAVSAVLTSPQRV